MRSLAIWLAIALVACTTTRPIIEPTAVPTHEAGTLDVSVLLDLSGARSSLGTEQRNAMQLWMDQQQGGTTITTRVKFVDIASADARLFVELRRAAALDRADAVVIGVPVEADGTFTRALEVAGLPVLLTAPAPDLAASSGWAFGLAPTYSDLARAAVDDASMRGLLSPTMLVSDESPAAIAERIAIGREMERRGLSRPTVVAVTAQDAPSRIRPGASLARSVLFAGVGSTYLDPMRSLASVGITPRAYLSYMTSGADVSSLREAAPMATWPGSRNVALISTVPSPAAQAFVQSYTERHGAPSTLAAAAFDALAIVSAAARQGGAAPERQRIRDQIESRSFDGVATRYAFARARHAGFDMRDLAYLRWVTTQGRSGIALAADPQPKEER